MLERLETRLAVASARLQDQARDRLAQTLAQEFPELDVSREPGRIILAARGLRRRMFADARLRWIGALLR